MIQSIRTTGYASFRFPPEIDQPPSFPRREYTPRRPCSRKQQCCGFSSAGFFRNLLEQASRNCKSQRACEFRALAGRFVPAAATRFFRDRQFAPSSAAINTRTCAGSQLRSSRRRRCRPFNPPIDAPGAECRNPRADAKMPAAKMDGECHGMNDRVYEFLGNSESVQKRTSRAIGALGTNIDSCALSFESRFVSFFSFSRL